MSRESRDQDRMAWRFLVLAGLVIFLTLASVIWQSVLTAQRLQAEQAHRLMRQHERQIRQQKREQKRGRKELRHERRQEIRRERREMRRERHAAGGAPANG